MQIQKPRPKPHSPARMCFQVICLHCNPWRPCGACARSRLPASNGADRRTSMFSNSQNRPATGSFSMFRDPAGGDPSSPFEDDPSLGESYPADGVSTLGDVVEDDEVEEEEVEDDGLEDDDEFEDDDDFEDEVDDDEEAALAPALLAQDDSEADDDSGDNGRENAVDEDKLNAEEEDDFS